MSNLDKYATTNGLDRNDVGEIVLTAMAGGVIPDISIIRDVVQFMDPDLKFKLGIKPSDSKETIIGNLNGLAELLEKRMEKSKDATMCVRYSRLANLDGTRSKIDKILSWLES